MLGLGKTNTLRPSGTASSARSRDIYQRYAAALYRQALLTHHDSALAEHDISDVIVNERALAFVLGRAEHGARYRKVLGIYPRDVAVLWHAVLQKLTSSSAAAQDADQP